jgi:chemotaxis protein methyltransferase CheR
VTVAPEETERRLLLAAIRERYGYDFGGYAPDSVARRLEAARRHFGCASLSLLQHRVLHEPAILPQLVAVLTVQVSAMFRDPGYFRALREKVVPHLVTCGLRRRRGALFPRPVPREKRTLFYATDISLEALARAERGVYALDRIAGFSESHRRSGARCSFSDYYTAAYGAAVLDKSLRSRAVFSDHSLVSDAVFAEMHLVSCRNVLIYFDQPLQERAVGLFRDSLVRRLSGARPCREPEPVGPRRSLRSVRSGAENLSQCRRASSTGVASCRVSPSGFCWSMISRTISPRLRGCCDATASS